MVDISLAVRLSRSSAVLDNGCVVWTGARSAGYGQLRWGGRRIGAHRAALQEAMGCPVPEGQMACHRCDNRLCINPQHLFLGSSRDNSADMVQKERQTRGRVIHSAKLTEADVLEIRAAPLNVSALARRFGISRRNVRFIRDRKTWTWLQ